MNNQFYTQLYDATVIEEYFKIIAENSDKNLSTFYMNLPTEYAKEGIPGAQSWSETPILNNDIIFFPTNVNHHWILITVKTKNKSIECYDTYHNSHYELMELIKNFLINWETNYNQPPSKWTISYKKTPLQTNNYDCGPWVLEMGKCIALNIPITFNQHQMPSIRTNQHTELALQDLIIIEHLSLSNTTLFPSASTLPTTTAISSSTTGIIATTTLAIPDSTTGTTAKTTSSIPSSTTGITTTTTSPTSSTTLTFSTSATTSTAQPRNKLSKTKRKLLRRKFFKQNHFILSNIKIKRTIL